MHNLKKKVENHYTNNNLLDAIELALKEQGKDLNNLKIEDLNAVDEMHSRGVYATNELIKILDANKNMHILDIGSGMGGPARRLAHQSGCHVTGIDLTASLTNIAQKLSKYTGLDKKVRHIQGDATNMNIFENDSFDGAWSIHAAMNIENKSAYYKEANRVLKPNSKFIIYDIFLNNKEANIKYPMPWAKTSATSFLINKSEVEKYLKNSGFKIIDIVNKTKETIDNFKKIQANKKKTLLLAEIKMGNDAKTKIANLQNNLTNGNLAVNLIVAKKM